MVRRAEQEIKEEAWRLFNQEGLKINEIADRLDIAYSTAFIFTSAREKGFNSHEEYKDYLAKRKGFRSSKHYKISHDEERKNRKENQQFSEYILYRLFDLKKTQKWLSEQIEVSKMAISHYISGSYLPSEKTKERIYQVLGKPDYLIEDDQSQHYNQRNNFNERRKRTLKMKSLDKVLSESA